MPESALFVPVPDAQAVVDPWRQQHDPAARDGVPAHITILYPFVPPDEITPKTISQLSTLFGNVDAFSFTLARTGRFPGILYLVPEPAEPFLALTHIVHERWPQQVPYGGAIGVGELVPHLTVTDGAPLETMESASAALAEHLPIETKASDVLLMTRFATRWNTKARFALS